MAQGEGKLNILVAALGSYGDVYPLTGIAARLVERGHDVTLFTHARFEHLARSHGLGFVPLDTEAEYRAFADHPDLFDPRKGFSVFMENLALPRLRDSYELLTAHVRPGRTVIVASLAVFGARLAQEKLGVPLATIHLSPLAIKSSYELPVVGGLSIPGWFPRPLKRLYWWVADSAVIDPLICPHLNALRGEIGLWPVSRVLSRWVHSPELVICLFPDWYAAPQPDWPPHTHTTGFPLYEEGDEAGLPGEVAEFLGAGDAPIVFMPGSLMQHATNMFTESVQACRILDRRAILLSRYAHQIPRDLPKGIRHFEYVPFGQLLPHAAALVHHGGIGTIAQALRAGIPQLVHPMAYDQYDNAARLRRLGVGDSIDSGSYRAESVARALEALTRSDEVARCCRAIAGRFEDIDAIGQTCDMIEGMLSR